MKIEEIITQTVIAIYSTPSLSKTLFLKGGSALDFQIGGVDGYVSSNLFHLSIEARTKRPKQGMLFFWTGLNLRRLKWK